MDATISLNVKNGEENEECNKENGKDTDTSHESSNDIVCNKKNGKAIDTSHEISNNINTKEKCNGRSLFYKKPIKKGNIKLEIDFTETAQEIRRQRLLHYQKKNRNTSFNATRGILEAILNPENEEGMEEGVVEANLEESRESEEMEVEEFKKPPRYRCYTNKLMMSEWMLEVPQDLADKWIMVPCPVGWRVLVIACKGSTRIFSKHGHFLCKFSSALPGGSYKTNIRNLSTILDCIWDKNMGMCYALDVMVWSSQELVDCESDFRFFWLKSRIEEISELMEEKQGVNEIKFSFLPTIPCNQDFYPFLETISSTFTVDGLLFYHKEAYYTGGKTPLVTWLKTYMLPEALGIAVPEPYDEKPKHYIDFQHHIQHIHKSEKNRINNLNRKKRLKELEQEKVQEKIQEEVQDME